MSKKGIDLAAEVFILMQDARQKLLRMGTKSKPINDQDLKLAQMLDAGNEAMGKEFTRITAEGELMFCCDCLKEFEEDDLVKFGSSNFPAYYCKKCADKQVKKVK